jgi:NAD(P)-dependent dehydrogenase (short-subunit alcohol dehydrogenase family)
MAASLEGRVCLVTGATSGIGFATAAGLARMGAKVLLHGRDERKGERALRAIAKDDPRAKVDLVLADFSSLAQVRRLAEDLLDRYPQLHVLVNNAGIHTWEAQESHDGFDLTFAVNHLAPFLLTRLLLERLRASAPARIVNVASRAHRWARPNGWNPAPDTWPPYQAYAMSKLANILFTRELARRLEGSGVTVNALHPGVIATNLTLIQPLRWVLPGPKRGARTSIYLASDPGLEAVSGHYFVGRRVRTPSNAAQDDAAARRLWEQSERLVAPFVEASRARPPAANR